MDTLTLWVTVGANGLLTSYSLIEQAEMIKIISSEEPVDYLNWGIREGRLVHYPEDVPEPVYEEPIKELQEQSEKLRQRADMSDQALLELADTVLSATKGGK